MDVYARYETNPEAERNGRLFDFGQGCKVRIARWDNPDFTAMYQKLTSPHVEAIRTGTLDDETAEAIMRKVVARTIVRGWEGLTARGEPVAYSPEGCEKLLADLPEFYRRITRIAQTMEHFLAAADEAARGN